MKYVIIVVIILIIVAVFLYLENNIIDITRYNLKSGDINGRIKIAHLSDLHSKPFGKLLNKLNELKPDLIFITGDFINDRAKNKEKMLTYAKSLTEIAPVYYITGNHERRLEGFDELMKELEGAGFSVLLDRLESINVKGDEIAILGLDENQADFDDYAARKRGTFQYKDNSSLFEELSKRNGFKIVLSHYPENFEKLKEMNYSKYDFDLQLSGHAHGGQFILPFFGPVFSPGQGIRPKYARGSFGERPRLIVSRGLGNSEFPFRLFNHPELIIITVSRNT